MLFGKFVQVFYGRMGIGSVFPLWLYMSSVLLAGKSSTRRTLETGRRRMPFFRA